MKVYLPNFRPSDPQEQRLQRALEILPAAMAWGTFVILAVLSFLWPSVMAVFMILFCLYWVIRVLYYSGLMVAAYARMRRESGIDWLTRAQGVSHLSDYVSNVEAQLAKAQRDVSNARGKGRRQAKRIRDNLRHHLREVSLMQLQGVAVKPWDSIYHLVVMATYREPYEVLETSMTSLVRTRYPGKKIIFILAAEEREGVQAIQKAQRLKVKFGGHFHTFLTTIHPVNLPGEVRGKAPNATWACREAKKWLDNQGIAYEDVITTVLDADTCVQPDYFACLTYHYITRPDRTRCSYQPLPMYHNNIWDAPAFSRMAASVTSCWQMVQNYRPDLLITFSNYAMSFQSLVDVDFWPVDIISEDAVIFYRCLMRYGGDYRTVPMFVALNMDANVSRGYWKTFASLYVQMRRWAWGVENIPLLVRGFLRNRVMPLRKKLKFLLQLVEVHYTWATAAIVLTFFVWLPLWIADEGFVKNVLSYHMPVVTGWIFRITGIGMVVTASLGILLMPPRPSHLPWWRWIGMVVQWILAPLYYVLLVGLPALDAQTRLMFGKYLSYVVTEKHRTPKVGHSLSASKETANNPLESRPV